MSNHCCFSEILPQKPQKDCVAISSTSPVNTRTAEWIATRSKKGFTFNEL